MSEYTEAFNQVIEAAPEACRNCYMVQLTAQRLARTALAAIPSQPISDVAEWFGTEIGENCIYGPVERPQSGCFPASPRCSYMEPEIVS